MLVVLNYLKKMNVQFPLDSAVEDVTSKPNLKLLEYSFEVC